MSRSLRAPALALVLACLAPRLGLAGANHVPEWSMGTDEEAAKAIKTFGFTTEGKADTLPRRIAIPYFVMRYDKTQVQGDASLMTVSFPESDYVALTDALYDAVVERFTDAGFEVVPRDAVVHAASYAALEGETGNDEGAGRFRAVPTGMKYLPTRAGQPSHANDLAALNEELGTDAVVAVYANFGLCPVDATPDTHMSGTKPCLRGNLTLPGLSVLFLGGAQGEGSAVKPVWTSRAYKEVVEFTYQKASVQTTGETAEVYDAALISPLDAVSWNRAGFWSSSRTGDADAGAYAEGVANMLDVAFTLAMETWYDKNAAAFEAAGVPRPARAPAPPGSQVSTATLKDLKEQAAAAAADLEAMKADALARPEGAPTASGTVSCYRAPAAGAVPETLLKRGLEATQVVDETIQEVPNLGPVQAVVIYTLGGGNTFTVRDAKNTWTGTGTFEGSPAWTTWHDALAFTGGYTADVDGTTEGTGYHVVTKVKGPDGAVTTTFDQHYTPVDAATCATDWADALAWVAAPPPGVPAPKKDKKKK